MSNLTYCSDADRFTPGYMLKKNNQRVYKVIIISVQLEKRVHSLLAMTVATISVSFRTRTLLVILLLPLAHTHYRQIIKFYPL